MQKFTYILLLFFFIIQNNYAQIDAYKAEQDGYFTSQKITKYGIVTTDNYASKIYLIKKGEIKEILATPNCGRYYSVSPDGEYIGFKNFTSDGKQFPSMLNIKTGEITQLHKDVKQCGQVSFSNNGKIAFTIENSVIIKNGNEIKAYDIGTYSNIAPISPDGNFVIYDKNLESLHLLDLTTGISTEIKNNEDGCIYPKWSPDGKKLVFSNRNNELLVWEKATKKLNYIDEGGNAEWDNSSKFIVYQKNKTDIKKLEFLGSEIHISSFDGLKKQKITNSKDISEMSPVFDGNKIIYNTYNKREIIASKFSATDKNINQKEILFKAKTPLKVNHYNISKFTKALSIKMVNGDVPYVHQLYDAPTGSNGGSACAPTTSTMALAYYNRLPKWPIAANNYTSVTGTNHTNDYSGYVLAKYRYNERYFDAYSSTKNAYGGYAYMWVSPYTSPGSGGMKGFQDHHNMTSGNIVWTSSCTIAKTRTEIDASYPHPICSWITHSGHLTLAVGYVIGQSTVIFNDPWGNKNTAGYPSYDGKNSYYDWPGYNNGYQNLDPDGSHGTVAWTLTARSSEPTYDDLNISNISYNHGFYMNNSQSGATQAYYRHVIDAAGSNGHIWWTGGEGGASSDICWVSWTPTIPQSSAYKVEVYIPSSFTDTYSAVAVSSSAYYKIYYNGGNTSVTVNQLANQGTWVDLGTYQFIQGQSGYIRLGDAVAVADNGKKVLFDAVRFTPVAGSIVVESTNVTCTGANDGTATVTTSPGPATHTYLWSLGGATTPAISSLSAGTYTVTVTDGLSATYQADVTILEAPALLAVTNSKSDPSSFGAADGSITANVSNGVAPFTYSWTGGVSTTELAQNLVAGSYTVTVTDAYGCVKTANTTLIDPICTSCCELLNEDFTGQILPSGWTNTINAGGYATYNWRFNNPGVRAISGADFDTDFAILDADFLDRPGNGNPANASLKTMAINCTGRNDVRLKFAHRFLASASHPADAKVEVSNDGTSWNLLETWALVSEGPVYKEYDISAYAANQSTVYIKWTYTDRTYYSNYWAIDNVLVYAPPAGTKTISAVGGDYSNFTEAINAINNCGVGTGGITFLVPANEIFTEDPPIITATGTATKPVVFQKSGTGANPIIKATGTGATNDAAITIAAGDYFTFDGIDVQLASGTALEFGYYLKNISATDGAQYNTIKNCSITLDKTNTNSIGINQLVQTSINPTSASGANSFNVYQNNTIQNAYYGMNLLGYDVAAQDPLYDDACEVSNCTISNFGGSTLRAAGILAWSQKNTNYFENTIYTGTTSLRTYGIYLAEYSSGNIYKNKIYDIYGTDTQVAGIRTYLTNCNIYENEISDIEGILMSTGIEIFGGTSNIYNNFVYDIKAPTGNSVANLYPSARGISSRSTTGTQTIFNNTVYVSYTSTNAGNESTCLYIDGSSVDSRNNIFENNSNATTGTRASCVYFKTTADLTNLSSNTRNNLFWVGTTSAKYSVAYNSQTATAYPSLANYVAALVAPREQSGSYLNPPYKSTVFPYNVHIDVTSAQSPAFNNLGTPISSPYAIANDIDNDVRNVTTPDVGADEFTPETYLCGTYTIDNTAATVGTNFNNFTDAINALNDRNISCAVVFNVHDNQIFTEDVSSIEITGTSTNTITFQKSGSGANPILKPTGTTSTLDFGFHINGGDYFTFDGIDIQIASGSALEIGYYLTNKSAIDGAQNNTIKNCSITLNNTNTNSTGIYQFVQTTINPTNATGANSFNTYDNVSVENSYHGFKIFGYDVTGQEPLYDDATEVKNCSVNNFGKSGIAIRAVGILTWSQKNLLVHDNTITNGTTNLRTLGYYGAGNNQGSCYNNTIHGLYGTGSQVAGLRTYESNVDFYNNITYDIEGVDMASGIEIYGGTSNIYNNFVWDIRTPATETYNYPTTRGISNRVGAANIFNNTIYLDYTSSAETNESAGIFVEGFSYDAATADIRNNISVNNVDVTTGAIAAAIYKSAEYSTISTNSDNNIYYSGTPSAKNLIFYDENSGDQTIAEYKTRTATYEQNSGSELPPFISTSGTYNLHLQADAPSLCNAGGMVIAAPVAITVDYDGDAKDASTPDIGADEFVGGAIWTGKTDNDWNVTTNWRPEIIPTSTLHTKIPANPLGGNYPESNSIVSKLAETNNLEIETGSHLWIEPAKYLTVNGVFNQNGTFILKSNSSGEASFINKSTINYGGSSTTTIEHYLEGNVWHNIAVNTQNIDASTFTGITSDFYKYDENINDSLAGDFSSNASYTNPSGTLTPSMKGYIYKNSAKATSTVNVTGEFYTGNQNTNLDYTNNLPTRSQFDGWNLVANPYPSAISIDEPTITKTNVDAAIYSYFDDGTGTNNFQYHIGSQASSTYPSVSLNNASGFIEPGKAVFVKANNSGASSIAITNTARIHNPSEVTSDYGAKTPNEFIKLQASLSGKTDEMLIRIIPESTTDYDGEYDAVKLFTQSASVPQLYSIAGANDKNLAINSITSYNVDTEIKLGLNARTAGTYTISMPDKNISLTPNIYLYDNVAVTHTDLSSGNFDLVVAAPQNFKNRFSVKFKNTILPVELLNFEAVRKENVVNIYWATSSEKNNDFFTIERSLDANNFEFVANYQGTGNSSGIVEYNITDNNPYSEKSYYRLKQTDINGIFAYSNIVAIDAKYGFNDEIIKIIKFDNSIYVEINDDKNSNYFIEIVDMLGKTLMKEKYDSNSKEIMIDKFPSGIYSISIINSSLIKTSKFFIE